MKMMFSGFLLAFGFVLWRPRIPVVLLPSLRMLWSRERCVPVHSGTVSACVGRLRAWLFLKWALAWLGLVSIPGTSAADSSEPVDPQALVAELREQRPENDSEMSAVLTIRAKGRDKQQYSVRIVTIVEPGLWKTRYEIRGASPKESESLLEAMEVTHFDGKPPRYEWKGRESSGAGGGTVAGRGSQFEAGTRESLRPFGGSEFWIADLGLEFLFWPEHKIVGRQVRRTRECFMLESRPSQVIEGGYAKVLSWIDIKTRQLVRAEAFDGSGRKVKMFKPDEFVYFKGQWRVKQLAIESPLTGSESYLIFNLRSQSAAEKPGVKP